MLVSNTIRPFNICCTGMLLNAPRFLTKVEINKYDEQPTEVKWDLKSVCFHHLQSCAAVTAAVLT